MEFILNESYLTLHPTMAVKLGLNEAIVLNQLHYRLASSPLNYGGYTWYHHTYAKWLKQFPFWSERTLSRIFLGLENQGIIVSTQHYNEMKVNKSKWYRIDYGVLYAVLGCQDGMSTQQETTRQIVGKELAELAASDLKEVKKEVKENHVDLVFEVINYLNQKTNTAFRVTNKATKRLVQGRISEGYTLEDFKTVIDRKVGQWLSNPDMKPYLRPSTLFSPSNFENYLNETRITPTPTSRPRRQPIVLDFEAGEED